MKLLIINGSHRNGNTDIIVKEIGILLKGKITVDTLTLRDIEMKLPDGCEQCAESERCPNRRDEFELNWLVKIKDYDGYILAAPTWDNGPTPLMKIFIDRIVCYCHKDRMWWKNKKIGVITHGMAGKTSFAHTIDWIKSVCAFHEAKFIGSCTFISGSTPGDISVNKKILGAFLSRFTI